MPPSSPSAPLLAVRALTVVRPGDAGPLEVLKAVSLDIDGGTLTDVVGPSGSGKTTLLLSLARLLPGAEGELTCQGRSSSEFEPQEWRVRIAYLPQRGTLVPGTVADNLTLPWRLKVRAGKPAPSVEELRSALDRVHLADVALDRPAERLSEGQAARVSLLRCVLARPSVLLLDEPDASLDEESAEQVGVLTSEFVAGGGGVVRVRHQRSDARADRRLRLRGGTLVGATG